MSNDEVTVEWLLDNLWIVGSPDDVADQLRQLYEKRRRLWGALGNGTRMGTEGEVAQFHDVAYE